MPQHRTAMIKAYACQGARPTRMCRPAHGSAETAAGWRRTTVATRARPRAIWGGPLLPWRRAALPPPAEIALISFRACSIVANVPDVLLDAPPSHPIR
jgi:hypothetical protein